MGGCASIDIYETYPDVKKFKSQFEAIHLNHNDIRKFYFVYRQMDNDNSGSIGLPELLAHIDIEVTDFSESVFSIFDKDGSGELDFREFVISTWNYCTLSRSTLGLYS
jgi:serine/threonine-protein phosphatase 2B regulatory subunit